MSTLTPTTTSSTPTITTGSSVNYTTSSKISEIYLSFIFINSPSFTIKSTNIFQNNLVPQVAPVGTVITLNPGNVYNISARNFYYGGGEILTWQFVVRILKKNN